MTTMHFSEALFANSLACEFPFAKEVLACLRSSERFVRNLMGVATTNSSEFVYSGVKGEQLAKGISLAAAVMKAGSGDVPVRQGF